MKQKIESNWWTRNWKWFVPTGFLGLIFLLVGFVTIFFSSIYSLFKSSDVYKQALVNTRKNGEVTEAIGSPINEGYFITGNINISGPSGYADFAIPISGSKGEGHVYVVATKKSGKWIFETLEVEIKGETERINLIDEQTIYQTAIEDLNQAISLNPNDDLAYYKRGVYREKLGEYQVSIEDYSKAIHLNPNNLYAYNNRGFALHTLGKYQAAIEDYNQVIRLNPNFSPAYYNRGNTHFELGEYQASIEDYSQAIRLNPNFSPAYYNRASAHYKLGKYQASIKDYNEAIRLNPNDGDNYYYLGITYEELENKQKAINNFQKAADIYQKKGYTNLYEKSLDKIRELQQ